VAAADSAAVAVLKEVLDQEKCIKQLVQNADRNAKFRSSQQKENQFIVRNVTEKEDQLTIIN
jgi:uncharacterized protein (DUF3084 family)